MEERKAFLLRIDPALMKELEAWAQDELRSVNGQIEYLLRQAVLRWRKSAAARLRETAGRDSTAE
ncbi:MAG: Arc family DNA binding domain-containing protein [Verrucomicrobiia bacterium]